jgi:hypothetical protein
MIQVNEPVGLEATFDRTPGLNVGVLIYNASGLFAGPLAANNPSDGFYRLAYTFTQTGPWWTRFVVYNEPELETEDTGYDTTSVGFQVVDISGGGGSSSLPPTAIEAEIASLEIQACIKLLDDE